MSLSCFVVTALINGAQHSPPVINPFSPCSVALCASKAGSSHTDLLRKRQEIQTFPFENKRQKKLRYILDIRDTD